MIYVREIRPAKKIPGYSSWVTSFSYDPAAVDAVKRSPLWHYDKKDYSWETPT